MREIKFRAWMPKDGKWYRGGAVQLIAMLGNSFGLSECNGKIIELQQYTGLKDKNGVEIYEGDIINFDGVSGVVEYKAPTFRIVRGEWFSAFESTIFKYHSKDFEVIGNIYENKELLR